MTNRKRSRYPAAVATGFVDGSASSSSSAAATAPSVVNVPHRHQYYGTHHINTCSPSPHHHHHGSIAAAKAAAAATVSPFVDRLIHANNSNNVLSSAFSPPLKLEPVQEETAVTCTDNDNNNLSQLSNTSSVTFAASDSSVRMMDLSGSGSSGGNAMIGTMVGSAVDSIVGCSVGGEPSSISSGSSYANTTSNTSMGTRDVMGGCHFQQESLPPTKRARMDQYEPHPRVVAESVGMDASPSLGGDMTCEAAASKEKWRAVNTINFKMNVDRPQGMCCHVCSLEASANDNGTNNAAATAFNGNWGQAAAETATTTPRSHSLLAYFQPTNNKKQAGFHNQKAEASSNANNNHHAPSLLHNFPSSTPTTSSNLNPCRYCDKPTCTSCSRQCENCQYRFCTFCTKVDYESSVAERILCFECDEFARMSNDGGRSDSDCDMMDL